MHDDVKTCMVCVSLSSSLPLVFDIHLVLELLPIYSPFNSLQKYVHRLFLYKVGYWTIAAASTPIHSFLKCHVGTQLLIVILRES